MEFIAKAKYISYALGWLSTYKSRRTTSVMKTLESAIANASNLGNVKANDLFVKEIRIDQGPAFKYFKPGAMGRSNPQTKRLSHISIVVGTKK
jgi:large subunit ribosomal protein L22